MHLHQLPSKRWRVIVKANGRQRTATADKRAEAQRLGAQLLLEMQTVKDLESRSVLGVCLACRRLGPVVVMHDAPSE